MPLSDAEQFQALLTVYHRVNERAIHYHSVMWQTAQVFSSGFTVLISGSFFFFTYRQPQWRAWSILLAFAAMLVALWGKRVLAQERTLFAYELQVRRRIEAALGWQLRNPTITPLPPLPAFPRLSRWVRTTLGITAFAQVVSFEMSYDPARVIYDPKKYNDVRFDGNDVREVAQAAQLRRGVYGVFGRVFSAAWMIALGLQLLYAARLYQPAFVGWASDQHGEVATATTSTSSTVAVTTSMAVATTSTAVPPTTMRGATGRTRNAPLTVPAAAAKPHSEPSPPRKQ